MRPLGTGQLHPGCAHLSALFSAMIHPLCLFSTTSRRRAQWPMMQSGRDWQIPRLMSMNSDKLRHSGAAILPSLRRNALQHETNVLSFHCGIPATITQRRLLNRDHMDINKFSRNYALSGRSLQERSSRLRGSAHVIQRLRCAASRWRVYRNNWGAKHFDHFRVWPKTLVD